jgi:hypothetical protein
MRLRLTLLLIALNGALVSVILYLERAQSTRDLLDTSTRAILDPDFLAGLSEIKLSGGTGERQWQLEKRDQGWFVTSPHDWKANAFAVDQLLFELHRLRWDSRFAVADLAAANQTLASYGLEQPALQLELSSGGQSLMLAFGTATEIGNRLYVRSADQKEIFVVEQKRLGFLSSGPTDLFNPEVFSLRPEEIRAFQIQDRLSNNTRVRLERRGQSWDFVSPVQTSANPEAVLAFLEQWSFLQTESFMDATTGLQSQAQESLRFTLEAFGKREILLLTAPVNPGDPYIGQREGFATAFALDANLVNSLRAVQGDLRERRLLRPHSQEWSSIEIQFGELNVSLQQLENGAWQVLHTDAQGDLRSYPADLAAIEQLRQLMLTMEAQGFVTDAPSAADLERFGLNDPQRLILIRKDNQQAVTLAIGGMPPDQDRALLYAQLDSNASVFLVRPDLLAAFSLDPFHYRDRTLFTLPADLTIDTISLTDRRQGNLVDLDARPDLQAALLDLLKQARVQRLLKYPFADPLPLDDGRSVDWPLELSITYTTGQEPADQRSKSVFLSSRIGGRTLLLGDPQSGLVGSLPEALAFLIDEVLVEFPAPPPPMSLPPEP